MIRKFTTSLLTIAACAAILTVACQAGPLPPLTHHVWGFTANGQAQPAGRLPASQALPIVLTLPLRNQPALQSFLQDLYNPSSPSFHKFLSVEEFTAAYGPTQEDYNALIGFAQAHGLTVTNTSRNRLNLRVTGTVANIEAALNITLGLYKDPEDASRTFFAPNAEPMADLSIPLWHISGLDSYSIPKPALSRLPAGAQVEPNATTGSCPSASFCGSDMRAAYYGTGPLTGAGQSVGLFEFYGTDLADLNTYYTNAHQTLTVPVTLFSVDGSSTTCLASAGCDDTEQTLDMTQALGMAPGLASLVMYVGTTTPSLDDSSILNAMATASPLNAQLACSWLWRPADASSDDPYFLEFAAQGQNFFVAAGDARKWPGTNNFYWPADDPNVVSVGGTDLTTASAGGPWATETAWTSSGGGISPDKFAIPSWQVAAAAGCSSCSKTYRNGPDVSANSNYTFYVCADQTTCTANSYGGTSFATPMWAGFLALANQKAVGLGGSVLGFINPTLYSTGLGSNYTANFHDITSGSNGFSATTGYDLVTGWGSPNGPTLINSLIAGASSANFTIRARPTTLTVTRGTSGHAQITTGIAGGFDSAIALSASGQGTGVKVVFNPSTIAAPGAGTSVMAVQVGKGAATGTSTITITGTGGGITHTFTVSLTIQ